jgi:hypothetical protein
MNVVVYNDTIHSPNFGCQLVSNSIRKYFSDQYPSYNIEYKQEETFFPPSTLPDKIIINGEGSFGHKSKNPKGWKLLQDILDWSKSIPVYLVNTTIHTSSNKLISQADNLNACYKVSVREPLSKQFLDRHNITHSVVYPDIGCYFFKNHLEVKKDIDICFGLGSIAKFFKPGYYNILQNYVNVFNELADIGYKIAVLNFPGNPKDDLQYLSPFISKKITVGGTSFEDYFKYVSRSKVNVTGRHHGAIMSFMGKTPFITFESNMWKTEGDQLLYGPFDSFNFLEGDTSTLKAKIYNILDNYSLYQNILNNNYNTLSPDFSKHLDICFES